MTVEYAVTSGYRDVCVSAFVFYVCGGVSAKLFSEKNFK